MNIGVGYFDESTDEVCYTVCGFVGNNHATAILDLLWIDLLKKYNLKYFKASELSPGEGQFRQYRDDPNGKRFSPFTDREKAKLNEIKTAFTDVIVAADGITAIGAVVILPDYERVTKEYPVAAKNLAYPYYLCAECILMEVGIQIYIENENYKDHEKVIVRPVFDSNEDYSGRVKQSFDSFCQKNPISSKYLLPPYYEDDQCSGSVGNGEGVLPVR